MKRQISQFLAIAVILAVGVTIFAVLLYTKPYVTPKETTRTLPLLSTIPVEWSDEKIVVEGFGTVSALHHFPIRTRVAGEISELHPAFETGGLVKSGEVILRIDPVDYQLKVKNAEAQLEIKKLTLARSIQEVANIKSTLKIEEEQLALTESDLARYREMLKKKSVSKQAYDNVLRTAQKGRSALLLLNNQLNIAANSIQQAEVNISQSTVMLEEAKLALERTTIVSPITGRFSERRVDLHQFVNANADVGGIIDLQKMQIETRISSDDFSWLMLSEPERQKKQVTITLLSPAHETPLMGHVSRVGATLDPTTRTHSLYVEITNSIADIISGVSVTPGTFCKMKFEGKTVKNILSLPFVSVKNNQVQVVRDGKLQVLPIEPIRFEGNRFLVQGDFKKEDQIIPSFRDNLTVGEAILTALQKGTRK